MATLKDVSKVSGVATATISRFLNNDKSLQISESTKVKILDAVKEVGYESKKVRSSSYKIAVVNWYSSEQEVMNPYYFYIRDALRLSLIKRGVELVHIYAGDSISNIVGIDGIVAIGKFSMLEVEQFAKYTENIVFVDSCPDSEKYDSVVVDFKGAVKKVINYCVENKFSDIAFLGGSETTTDHKLSVEDERLKYFKRFAKEHNLYNEANVLVGSFTMDSGYEMMQTLIKQNDTLPNFVFCANDLIAIGANKALYDHGIKVGQDIRLFGFDNIPTGEYTTPSLSTVEVHQDEMGRIASGLIIDKIESKSRVAKKIVVPTSLKERSS